MNAWKHGLTAEKIVVGDEDPQELEALYRAFEAEWKPVGITEVTEVRRLTSIAWRQDRIAEYEGAVIDRRRCEVADQQALDREMFAAPFQSDRPTIAPSRDDIGSALIHDSQHGDALGKLQRYDSFLSRSWTATMQRLIALQAARREREEAVKQIDG
jgi:hypothetical protein